jgi:hypothetical protein
VYTTPRRAIKTTTQLCLATFVSFIGDSSPCVIAPWADFGVMELVFYYFALPGLYRDRPDSARQIPEPSASMLSANSFTQIRAIHQGNGEPHATGKCLQFGLNLDARFHGNDEAAVSRFKENLGDSTLARSAGHKIDGVRLFEVI